MILLKGLFAKLKAELAFVVLLAVASAGAVLYVRAERAIADRDAVLHRAELICKSAGIDFLSKRPRVADGVDCGTRVQQLAEWKGEAERQTAELMAQALADNAARQARDNDAARRAAEAAKSAALAMEKADAEAERRNLVDREWFAAVNNVAGLRPAD
ncbi:hypothetical protein QE361_000011 [Sphingomonas sp. SORGH_AS802]|uniref:hypothetical protein n=1 Tax=Sphingomonas sp. SORGH_AS_0802 TaxID=3041800 RepID=UPI002859203A|nr:hypothetical protein [Sphingomonas sp. SORGH_AS_0802]MDR6133053.1 hypothetical protein [Sphingomonas sp. SORGH_AS_0802]